ncbi:hypothetical protein EJ05DRAFT_511679 [Pseudovirgaria hyperparasitica]|uniref:ribonuclease Z n=1 Tax=Pseudovirgaria hyperparasitica TaxID=470096 RepID=A0A6A6W419_9PEZI|nr:uncharacterized protein EJ05DRAFT_511679 [Pseudovirgaria hyperparasitica]KAF2756909.1 hypothetical protein EJ05DRAFT_511679 [Pseudovirgaria hyperparasitica]
MATAVYPMSSTPFNNSNSCEPDVEEWFNFSDLQSSNNGASSSQMPASSAPSALTSPATTIAPLDGDDFQAPAKPSYEYDRFKQQTGLPSGSVPGLQNSQFQGFSNTGLDDMSMWSTGLGGLDSDMNMDTELTHGLPAFFYPNTESSHQDDFVDPSTLTQPEEPANVRVWPGVHQQQALAKAQAQAQQQRQQQMLQQQQKQTSRPQQQSRTAPSKRSASHQPTDARTEETIARVVNQIRQNSQMSSQNDDPHAHLPHIIRMKKDEEDMDEDERLLASEEGKKLTSKERRQLRNKVSARAFRSRRKEYIGQLEGEVNQKANECNELRIQNRALMEENARSRAFIENLLRHQAFAPFLEDLSRDEALQPRLPIQQQQTAQPARKDANAYQAPQQFESSRQDDLQIGMALVPETPLDLSMLSINNTWGNQNLGFPFQQPQVFSVMEVPEGPILNAEMLSGKEYEAFDETETVEPVDDVKQDFPVVGTTYSDSTTLVTAKPAETEEERAFDNNPEFALYHPTSPSAPVTSTPTFDNLSFEGVTIEKSSQFELVVPSTSSDLAMERVERICASMEPLSWKEAEYKRRRAEGGKAARQRVWEAQHGVAQPTSSLSVERGVGSGTNFERFSSADGSIKRALSPWEEWYGVSNTVEPVLEFRGTRDPSCNSYAASFISHGDPLSPHKAVSHRSGEQRFGKECILYHRKSRSNYRKEADQSQYMVAAYIQASRRLYESRMKTYIKFLTAPTLDTPGTAVALRFDHDKRKYLFGNMSEGTQRAAIGIQGSFKHVHTIFMTGKLDWHSIGGLVGTLLTVAEARSEDRGVKFDLGTRDMIVHGPPNLKQALATCRRFVFRKGIPVYAFEHTPNVPKAGNIAEHPTWQDDIVKAWAMAIEPSHHNHNVSAPENPRKRSFDQAMGWASDLTSEQQEKQYNQLRESIVGDMFNSNWRMDALYDTNLRNVELPAEIFIRDPDTKEIKRYEGPVPGDLPYHQLPDITVLVRKAWPAALVGRLPPTKPSSVAVSYIARTHPIRGKFDPKKALELGLRDKTKYKDIAKGEPVENDKGEMIQPDQVLGKGSSGEAFAIIELPGVEYVEPLIARAEWKTPQLLENMQHIVWILAPGVLEHRPLQDFMRKLSDDLGVHHIVSSTDTHPDRAPFISAAGQHARLNKIDPCRFPALSFDDTTIIQSLSAGTNISGHELKDIPTLHPPAAGIEMATGSKFEQSVYNQQVQLDMEEELKVLDPSILKLSEEAAQRIKDDAEALDLWKKKIPEPDTEVFSLGTGSAVPSNYRNVSATLVRVPGKGAYLFDAGEGTWGQIQRVFGPEGAREVMKELRMIWISHMHADHHLGVTSVIRAWRDTVHGKPGTEGTASSKQRLAVISAVYMIDWLREYSEIEDYGYSHILPLAITAEQDMKSLSAVSRSNLHLHPSDPASTSDPVPFKVAELMRHTHLSGIRAVTVHHCHGARAVSIAFPSGLKISYSGDCRPSPAFARIGKDSTLLIHEATFDDDLRGDAEAKKHSTTGEALEIGQMMGAKCVLLTHFSQRYSKIPIVEADSEAPKPAKPPATGSVLDDQVAPSIRGDTLPQPTGVSDLGPDLEDDLKARFDGDDDNFDNTLNDARLTSGDKSTGPADVNRAPSAAVFKVSDPDLKVGIAFDYMRVKLGEFAHLKYYTPALIRLFSGPEEDVLETEAKPKKDKRKKNKEVGPVRELDGLN